MYISIHYRAESVNRRSNIEIDGVNRQDHRRNEDMKTMTLREVEEQSKHQQQNLGYPEEERKRTYL